MADVALDDDGGANETFKLSDDTLHTIFSGEWTRSRLDTGDWERSGCG